MGPLASLACEDSWMCDVLHLATVMPGGYGTELGPLSSSQLFTFKGLIEKELSPGCECITKTGAEVTSSREERAGSREHPRSR